MRKIRPLMSFSIWYFMFGLSFYPNMKMNRPRFNFILYGTWHGPVNPLALKFSVGQTTVLSTCLILFSLVFWPSLLIRFRASFYWKMVILSLFLCSFIVCSGSRIIFQRSVFILQNDLSGNFILPIMPKGKAYALRSEQRLNSSGAGGGYRLFTLT